MTSSSPNVEILDKPCEASDETAAEEERSVVKTTRLQKHIVFKMASWKRLARFVPKGYPSRILIGEPENHNVDVGLALYKGKAVKARVFNGNSVLEPGAPSGEVVEIDRVLSPLTQAEVGTIRCIGLNYKQHADEAGLDVPTVPTVFMKPATSLADPYPARIFLPKLTQVDDCGDYESELAIVIGKECKNVSEADAYDYVLGYTAANDVSSRTSQFAQSQWSFSKAFDDSCPIDPQKLNVRGLKNGQVMQECSTDDLIFSVPKIVSFLSQSTTMKPGTIIITGTPGGVGMARKPQVTIKEDDVFFVEILPYIGTLVNVFKNEE
ncbi:hypothetical protein VTL71DRAFT_12579 [Oculimacula yallundae]|uniref:Fumarylacetoacetase-like C-terminal domain-containing protein n=1 Tax=Oculimacula yallundae TaxID=86028 RepID=A0ABR4CQL8_9HELO